MDAKKLASLLRGGPGGPLVIDSRSFVEYNSWHVLSSVNICCSKLVKRRLQQGKVTIAELIQPAVRGQLPDTLPAVSTRSLGLAPPPPPHCPQGHPVPGADYLPTQAPVTSGGQDRTHQPGTQELSANPSWAPRARMY